jgi:hypothetical protein
MIVIIIITKKVQLSTPRGRPVLRNPSKTRVKLASAPEMDLERVGRGGDCELGRTDYHERAPLRKGTYNYCMYRPGTDRCPKKVEPTLMLKAHVRGQCLAPKRP